jgi:ribonuclease P protein component
MDANRRRATFPKKERLFRKRYIDTLFSEGMSMLAFPLRIVYLPVEKDGSVAEVSVLVSVSKRKLRHAVDRNFIKRRIRESYRLRKQSLLDSFADRDRMLLMAFLYLGREKVAFNVIDRAMEKAMSLLLERFNMQTSEAGDTL